MQSSLEWFEIDQCPIVSRVPVLIDCTMSRWDGGGALVFYEWFEIDQCPIVPVLIDCSDCTMYRWDGGCILYLHSSR